MKSVPQVFAIALFAGATTLLPTQDSEAWWGGGRDRDRWDDDRWYDGPGYGGYPGGGYGGYPGGGYGGYPGGGYGGYPGGGYPGGWGGGYPGYGGYGGGYPAYGGGYAAPQSAPPASTYSEPSRSAP